MMARCEWSCRFTGAAATIAREWSRTLETIMADTEQLVGECGVTLSWTGPMLTLTASSPSPEQQGSPAATSALGLGSPLPHVCTGTGLTPATSAPGLGSPLPHLHRDWS